MNNKKKARKKKAREAKAKKRVLARRKILREEAKELREIEKIKRDGEKEMNRLIAATEKESQKESENTQD
tara:strand:+ start:2095 stop:2304 length:210 start_codon:yes stop_codon:yes gene_type:complete